MQILCKKISIKIASHKPLCEKFLILWLFIGIWLGLTTEINAREAIGNNFSENTNQDKHIYSINNPTAETLADKTLYFGFQAYNNGGIQNKLLISIYKFFDLGVTFHIEHALGDGSAHLPPPGVIGKIQFTRGTNNFPIFVSIGYDAFFNDPIAEKSTSDVTQDYSQLSHRKSLDQVFLGPYILITKPIYIFSFEQLVHAGWRMPVQPEYLPEESAFFLGLDIPLGPHFMILQELDRIYLKSQRLREMLYNLGLRFFVTKNFNLSFYFMMGEKRNVNRALAINYQTHF